MEGNKGNNSTPAEPKGGNWKTNTLVYMCVCLSITFCVFQTNTHEQKQCNKKEQLLVIGSPNKNDLKYSTKRYRLIQ